MCSLVQLLLAQTHATERRKPVLTDPSSEPLLGKGLDLRVVRVVPKEAAGVVHLAALAGVRQRPQGFCVLQRWKCGPAGRSRDGGLSPVVGHRTGLTEDLPSSQTETVILSAGEPAYNFF